MKLLTDIKLAQAFAKVMGKPVIYFNLGEQDFEEVVKAAPYLANWQDDNDNMAQIMFDGSGFILCEDEAEMKEYYYQTVGDDGTTKYNPYNGPARVYALAIEADGEIGTENT